MSGSHPDHDALAAWRAERLPDARDGLTRLQRVVLHELDRLRRELGRESVPTIMLYGRVCEHLPITEAELNEVLQGLGAGAR